MDGDRLSETDLDNFFSILVVAGNETTRIAIAQGVLAFCRYPEQWDRLRADPGLIDAATDEVIRWSCPTHFMRRTAAADTELGGARVRAGDKVVLAALARRVSRFELAGEPRRIRSNFTPGLKALPVRVSP